MKVVRVLIAAIAAVLCAGTLAVSDSWSWKVADVISELDAAASGEASEKPFCPSDDGIGKANQVNVLCWRIHASYPI